MPRMPVYLPVGPYPRRPALEITYDPEANAAYVTIGPSAIAPGQATINIHSIETPGRRGEIILDFDAAGRLLGVEVLNAREVLAPEVLADARPPDPG